MHGSRTPTEEEKRTSAQYRKKRKENKIGLPLMAKMTGYSCPYLSHIESGYDPATLSFVEEYDRVIQYINDGCQKNKRKRKNLKKSS